MTGDDECAWVHLSLAWAVLTLDYIAPDTASFSKWSPTHTDVPSWLGIGPTCRDTTTCGPSTGDHGADASTFFAAGSRAKTYPSPEAAPDSPASEAGCSTNLRELQMTLLDPVDSFFSKTSPVFCHRTVGEISPSFSRRWANSGFATSLGACWIANTSECHNGGDAFSSLGDVVSAEVAPRFFLSPKAAAGILRRAEKRHRSLPDELRIALVTLANVAGKTYSETIGLRPPYAPTEVPTEAASKETATTPTPLSSSTPWTSAAAAPTTTKPKPDTLSLVRRLTPTECERLQGFPDGWTVVDFKKPTRARTGAATPASVTP